MKQRSRVRVTDLKRIKERYYHGSLPEHLIERIKTFKDTFAEFYPITLEEWIRGFRMDMDPESEITIWEQMAEKYRRLSQIRCPKSKEERGEIYKTVMLESCESDPIEISAGTIPMA